MGEYWYEPIETLHFQMQRKDIARAVLIQFVGNYDNRYVLECVSRYPDRLAAVVLVDPQKPDSADTLEERR